jgi:calpain-15
MNSYLSVEPEELIPGLILHKNIKDAPLFEEEYKNILEWELENETITKISFEVVYCDFKNVIFVEDEYNLFDKKKTFSLEPNEKKKLAKIKLKKDFKINIALNCKLSAPDLDFQIKIINGDKSDLEEIKNLCYENLNKIDLTLKTKEELENLLNGYNINNFIDWNFPPNDNSLINNNLEKSLNDYLKYIPFWKRPKDFINIKNNKIKEYYLYNQKLGPLPNDIIKGFFDDKSLISVLSALTEKNKLIKRLFVNNNNSITEKGIYQIKLYIKGKWEIIIIDDLFPCYIMGNPIVTRSPSNIIWVLLLEKAIAKICKCYYNIKNLKISDCFLLLTGFPTFYFNINDMNDKSENEEEEEGEGENKFLEKLKTFIKDKKYICQAIRENQEDIDDEERELNENIYISLLNYGYTILDILKLKNIDNEWEDIVILRKILFDKNKEEIIENEQLNLKKNFIELNNILNEIKLGVTFSTFVQQFNTLYVCYTKNWETINIKSKFIRINKNKVNENVLSEKYFEFEGSGNIIISLYQDDDDKITINNKKQVMDISLTLLKYDIINNEISHKETLDFFHTSSLQMEFNNLPLGNYIIYPKTSGCFLGKPINNKHNEVIDYKNNIDNIVVEDTIKDIFNLYDIKLNNYLEYNEFKSFYKQLSNDDLSKDTFDNYIIKNYDNYKNIGITKIGFKNYFKDFIKKSDKNIFENFGYDKELYNNNCRQYILTIHSDKELNIKIKDNIGCNLNSKFYKILLKLMGKNWNSKENDQIIPKYIKSNSNIVTIGLFNKTDKNLRVILRLKNTNNFILGGNYKYRLDINKGEIEFITNIYCINSDNFDSLQFKYEIKEI